MLTTGEAGLRSQAMGLAMAVGLPIVEKRIIVRPPWSWLPSGLLPLPHSAFAGDKLATPWPQLVVSCGRRSIGAALFVKRRSRGATLAAYVQNPKLAGGKFDLVAAMPHDGVAGANVVTVGTALHAVTPERLAEAETLWRDRLAPRESGLIGVLLGGDSGGYRLTKAILRQLVDVLRRAHASRGWRAAITPSRRTSGSAKSLLGDALAGEDWAMLWTEEGENPYLGILALSDRLVVTGESISMISEALATGRPVHVLPLEGQARRHDAFLSRIVEEGLVSLVEGSDLDWSFAGAGIVNATAEPAARLRQMLADRGCEVSLLPRGEGAAGGGG